MDENTLRQSLKEYIALTSQIRLYSSPLIEEIMTANEYRSTLVRNFTQIGVLSGIINRILNENVYPLLEDDRPLSDTESKVLTEFSRGLVDMYTLTSLDPMISYLIARKLVDDADRRGDEQALILALDGMVETAFAMMEVALRLTPCSDIGYTYRETGLQAGRRLLTYLEKARFAALPDEDCKHKVLINSRYITALLFWNGAKNDAEDREDIELLQRALELADDPFYREQAPNYNWDYHVFRTLQYMVSYSERLNMRGLKRDLLERLEGCAEQLLALSESNPEKYNEYCPRHTLELYRARLTFLTGHLPGEKYKTELRRLIDQGNLFRFGIHDNIANLFSLDEYLLAVKEVGTDEQDQISLNKYYRNLSLYVHRMPKVGSISFVASILSHIIKDYADLPVGGFEESSMQMIAAMHPLTYVHSLTVAALAKILTGRLLKREPERFIGFAGSKTAEEVLRLEPQILEHAENAALCHDIGKLFVIEIIMTYGRALRPEEFELINQHARIGAHVLLQHEDTRDLAAVAQCHHYYYNEMDKQFEDAGFPACERPFVDITCCADSMDAATDFVGRSYKTGKTFEEFRAELDESSGTRYAPYVVELLHDEELQEEIENILSQGREENYRRTYSFLSRLTPVDEEHLFK